MSVDGCSGAVGPLVAGEFRPTADSRPVTRLVTTDSGFVAAGTSWTTTVLAFAMLNVSDFTGTGSTVTASVAATSGRVPGFVAGASVAGAESFSVFFAASCSEPFNTAVLAVLSALSARDLSTRRCLPPERAAGTSVWVSGTSVLVSGAAPSAGSGASDSSGFCPDSSLGSCLCSSARLLPKVTFGLRCLGADGAAGSAVAPGASADDGADDEVSAETAPADESESSATAMPGLLAIAAPMPSATASAPTRPTYRPYPALRAACRGPRPGAEFTSPPRVKSHRAYCLQSRSHVSTGQKSPNRQSWRTVAAVF